MEHSSTFSSVKNRHVHPPTHFNALYSAFAFIIGLLCIAVIILISVWRYRQRQVLLNAVSRRHGGRRLISTYPQVQIGAGRVVTRATVTLPPPYCEAIATPPPYSVVDQRQPASVSQQTNVTSTASVGVGSVRQAAHESENLLSLTAVSS